MKKILLFIALATALFVQSQTKAKYLRLGKLTTAEIAAIDVSDTSVIYTAFDTDLGKERINTGSGWVDRISGSVSGTVDYADILNKPAAIDENSNNDVEKLATSPDAVLYWKGTKAQLYSEYGNPPTGLDADGIYVVTDSIPATPNGGGDMLQSTYDADSDNVVDNAEQLGGVAAASYLQSEVDGSTSNELQTLSISGQDITLSDGGGTVTVPSGVAASSGTFTPTLSDSDYTVLASDCHYYKVGKMVFFSIYMEVTEATSVNNSALQILGLPFSADGSLNNNQTNYVVDIYVLDNQQGAGLGSWNKATGFYAQIAGNSLNLYVGQYNDGTNTDWNPFQSLSNIAEASIQSRFYIKLGGIYTTL